MNIRITLLTLSLIYTFMIFFIYFSKKRVLSVDNKIYEKMLLITPIGLLLELGCNLTSIYSPGTIIALIVSKLYLIFIVVWLCIFTLYISSVTLLKGKKIVDYSKSVLRKTIIISGVVFSMLTLILPVELNIVGEQAYLSGIGVVVLVFSVAIYMLYDTICYFLYFKKINNKERLPMIILIIIVILLIVLNKLAPEIQIVSSAFAFITILMFHTIENPDVKMINELELAKNQAEKANRAKTDFLSSMSHEIRTPLNAIVGLSEMIQKNDNIDEIHEDASDVVNASHTLLEIVNGILDISRIEADKMEIVEEVYNPLEEFNNVAKLIETRIGEKEIEFRTDFAIDLPETLYGDKSKVKQIITNLLSNAVKYTEKGYIDFKVTCINEKDISKLTITISDTGRGIKKEQMDNLFTKFNRLDSDKNTTIEGTGLGLAITKAITEIMGGKIVVDSTYGEGSKFTVFLSQKITNDNSLDANEEKLDNFKGNKVLIVDDNRLNIKVASKILKEFDLDIDTCESGFECINKIENGESYNAIFMDIMMPNMSGVETLKKLKKIDNFNTPVVALTADAILGKSNKYLEVGFNDYISKPIDKNKLNNVLNRVLNHIEIEDEVNEDPDIHKVTPITDEDIAELNRLFGEPTVITKEEREQWAKEKEERDKA